MMIWWRRWQVDGVFCLLYSSDEVICEIEGPPRWIDATAKKLEVPPKDYITKNYATLFADWKQRTCSPAKEMTFKAVKQ